MEYTHACIFLFNYPYECMQSILKLSRKVLNCTDASEVKEP